MLLVVLPPFQVSLAAWADWPELNSAAVKANSRRPGAVSFFIVGIMAVFIAVFMVDSETGLALMGFRRK